MKPPSPLSFFSSGRKTRPAQVEIEALIELLPVASILIEKNSGQVLFANSMVTELTSFTRAELCQFKLADILLEPAEEDDPEIAEGQVQEPGVNQAVSGMLSRRNGSKLAVQVTRDPLGQSGRRSLVQFEPVQMQTPPFTDLNFQEQIWQSLYQMAVAINEPEEEKALDRAIKTGHELARTSLIAYYRLEALNDEEDISQTGSIGGREVLRRKVFIGDENVLPESLPPHELVTLHSSQLWTAGKRMISLLHRTARAKEYSFIATAPVGLPEINGLLVIGEAQKQPNAYILRLVQLIASAITTLTRQHDMLSDLETELQEKSAELVVGSTAINAVKDGLLITTPDLIIRKINPAAEMILGYTSREVLGIPIDKVFIGKGELSDALESALAIAQEGRPTYDVGQVRLYRRNGEAFLAQVRTQPVLMEDQVSAIIVQFEDLTEQEQIQERTRQLEQQAFLGEFTAVFAHEVRNPINNISTGLQLLEMTITEPDPNHDVVMRLQTDCDRLTDQMRQVLSFARTAEYTMESIDLEKLLRSLLDRLSPRIVKENVKYRIQAEPDLPKVEGSPRVLEQVFNNLITNAVQAMRGTGGQLVVKLNKAVYPHGFTYVKISIADTGPGIAKENLDKIFQPFYTTKHDGTGLGLPIAKRIITAHKGRIQVESFPGGTVFTVEIPAQEPAAG
jgi:two-component system sensor histidine kinase AtoS